MSKKKFHLVKYLELSQGAGQLVAQLDIQVLSLKPAHEDPSVNNPFPRIGLTTRQSGDFSEGTKLRTKLRP